MNLSSPTSSDWAGFADYVAAIDNRKRPYRLIEYPGIVSGVEELTEDDVIERNEDLCAAGLRSRWLPVFVPDPTPKAVEHPPIVGAAKFFATGCALVVLTAAFGVYWLYSAFK